MRDRGAAFGVQATPTFFINGKKFEGALSLEELDKAIDAAALAIPRAGRAPALEGVRP